MSPSTDHRAKYEGRNTASKSGSNPDLLSDVVQLVLVGVGVIFLSSIVDSFSVPSVLVIFALFGLAMFSGIVGQMIRTIRNT